MIKQICVNYEIKTHASSGRIFSKCLACEFEYPTRYTAEKLPTNRPVCPQCNSRRTTLGRFLFGKCSQAEFAGEKPELTEEAKAWVEKVGINVVERPSMKGEVCIN